MEQIVVCHFSWLGFFSLISWQSLALLEQDIDVKLHILDLLQNLSAFSRPNCDKMLAADAASRICSRMNDPEPSGR